MSLGTGRSAGRWGRAGGRRRLALAKHDPVDRGIAEEAVDLVDDHRRQMLDQRRVRAVDQQGQHAAAFAAGRETDRFGRRDLGVALADDLRPAADDRALDEAEAAERLRRRRRRRARRPRAAGSCAGSRRSGPFASSSRPRACHSEYGDRQCRSAASSNIMWITSGACHGDRAPGAAAARSLSRLAERGDAPADDGRDRAVRASSGSSSAGRRSRRSRPRSDEDILSRMGGPRLLRPRPQSDRLRPRSRAARRLSADRLPELRQLPGHRRLYLGGDRRDRIRRARGGGRYQRRARDRPAQRAASGRRGARSSGWRWR